MDEPTPSKYLQYLPAIFQRMPQGQKTNFLGQFLVPFEDVFDSFEEVLAVVDRFFSPSFTPAQDFLPWLATWIALVLDEEWEEDKRRRLLSEAMELYRWRGTVYGMKRYLEIYTGLEPDDIDIRESRWPAGMQIGVASRIGFTAQNTTPPGPYTVFHGHPQADLPPEQRNPKINIARHNDLVDFVDSPSRATDAVAHDYYWVDTIIPPDSLPAGGPATLPVAEPFQIIYRADTIEKIELEEDGVRLHVHPRQPDKYPADTRVGGTFLSAEMARAYCFIVNIRGLVLPRNPEEEEQGFARQLSKIRLILDTEKPAHTQYYLKFTPAADKYGPRFMQIGVYSSIGLDTTIS
jgi:phage tail-like protein